MTVSTEPPQTAPESDDTGSGAVRRLSLRLIALLILGALVLGAASWAGVVVWRTWLPDGVAMRVGGQEITTAEVEDRGRTMAAVYGVDEPPDAPDRDTYRRSLAQSVAVSEVLVQAGAQQGVGVGEQEARALLDGFVRDNYPQGRAAFVDALGEAGTSEPAILREIQLQALTGRLFGEVTKDVPPVTDPDLRAAYDSGRPDLVVPEQRAIRNIVLPGQTEADEVAQAARSGADFGGLVSRSIDGSTRDTGGDLGSLPASAFEKPYADAAFAVPSGAVFGPVQTSNGWNVGQVVSATPARPLGFDEVKDQLREKVATERALETWRGWVSDHIEEADVVYADEYRPADPGALPSVGPAGPVTGDDPAQVAPAPAAGGLGPMSALLALGQLALAGLLAGLGWWGRSRTNRLVSDAMPEEQRIHRIKVLRRGGLACYAVAGLLMFSVVMVLAVARLG